MAKTPSLLDIIARVPARDLAKAAKAMGISPDALKKRAEAFESALGLNLIDTAAKALKPGEASRLVMDHASRIFSQARDLTRDLEELAGLQAPELKFGTDMFVAELPLGTALGRMATANSRLRVHAQLGDFEELGKAVLAGRLEFAIADTTSAERHPTRLAIEPVAEHRVFFFVRQGHPLTSKTDLSLDTILVFPMAGPRLPQRIAVHLTKALPHPKVDRETGDLSPSLAVDSFSVARSAVLAGDAIGLAPLATIESDLKSGKLALVPYEAPWLHLSYGLFYPRKNSLSRVAQLFVTQLRQVETMIQAREQRALLRMEGKGSVRKTTTRKSRKTAAPRKRAAKKTVSRSR